MGDPGSRHQGLAFVREPIRTDLERRAWEPANRALLDAVASLNPPEQLWLAQSAYLLGSDDDCLRHLEAAYPRLVDDAEPAWAARAAFWLAWVLFDRGEVAQGGGWLARGHRLLDDHQLDVVEAGYLAALDGVRQLYGGDGAGAERHFRRVLREAQRFDEVDLLALARLGMGEALRVQGALPEAVSLLDEAMVAVVADEVCPIFAGLVYCAVIEACEQTYDLRRAQEWTAALSTWCDSQPDLVPYRGNCQVHRVEVLRMHGSWRDAMTAAVDARRRLAHPPGHPAVGAAIYQKAELHRLRGQHQLAEEGYTEASRYGHDPQPGLAYLRLTQGDAAAGAAGLRRALDEGDASARPRLLSAFVEVSLACGDDASARAAADELAVLAERADIPLLTAIATRAAAEVALATGDPATALRAARRSWTLWNDFGAPYEAARARVLVGHACERLADRDAARLELDAARRAFEQLGATDDLRGLDEDAAPRGDGPLSAREAQVLRLVAEGRTNRSVATELHLSDKTVARHLSNIYLKVGVSTRAGATAWAYEHDVVHREPEAGYTG